MKILEFEVEDRIFFITCGVIAFVFLLIILSTVFKKKTKASGNTILLTGLCGAGKTSLITQLNSGHFLPTQTSQKPNDKNIEIQNKKVHIIDYPGHHRLRNDLWQFFPVSRGIVFMIDSTTFEQNCKENSEFLMELFVNKHINEKEIPFLLFCNKSEIAGASKQDYIWDRLEKEIEKLRKTQNAIPKVAQSEGTEDEIILGFEGEKFCFSQVPFDVSIKSGSIKEEDVDPISDYILDLLSNS